MNQTVTVNISGIVFHIEVDAYENLKKYLNKIRGYFKDSEESEEIMTDIEARIAELFSEKITSNNQVVNTKDVDEVITIMGKPEQYIDEDEELIEEKSYTKQRNHSTAKKLFRDSDDRIIGGVASGIAAYFGINSAYIRFILIVSGIFGYGILAYFIMWAIIPEAKTAADKLQMKGDPVNIDNLSCREVPNSIPRGSEIPFDVKVIPIRRQQETRKEIDVHTHNKMAGMTLIPKESYFEWMEERLGVGVLLDFERFHIVDSQRRTSLRKGKVISKKEISVSGVMKIIDPDDFQAILKRGIGRHKSYGFGMILLRQR
mgnify:CR=1 FL=1